MQDIESLRDYLIADEIQRIQSMTPEEVVRELIEAKTGTIETMTTQELLQSKNETH